MERVTPQKKWQVTKSTVWKPQLSHRKCCLSSSTNAECSTITTAIGLHRLEMCAQGAVGNQRGPERGNNGKTCEENSDLKKGMRWMYEYMEGRRERMNIHQQYQTVDLSFIIRQRATGARRRNLWVCASLSVCSLILHTTGQQGVVCFKILECHAGWLTIDACSFSRWDVPHHNSFKPPPPHTHTMQFCIAYCFSILLSLWDTCNSPGF